MTSLPCSTFRSLIGHFETVGFTGGPRDGVRFEDWSDHFHACGACSDAVLEYRLAKSGHDPGQYACVHLAYRATQTCEQHPDRASCDDLIIAYDEVFDEYRFIKGAASYKIDFCPWCGTRLPSSQRDRWFDELETLLGCSALQADDIPSAYRSKAWRLLPKG